MKTKRKRRFSRVPKDKATGVPKKYLAGSKSKSRKAAEIKKTAELYKKGMYIDVKSVSKSRTKMASKPQVHPLFKKKKKNGSSKKK
tara:strand:- start:451 stop:708 length:258 start_codon:yes stop_codon:yes gene_type:complete